MSAAGRLDVVTFARLRNPRSRLVCFPCSGGTPTEYRHWSELGRYGVEVSAVRLPGRELRLREPPFRSLPRLIDALIPHFESDPGCPTVFFGHSMGALVAFELAHALRATAAGGSPAQLLVAARIAPHVQSNSSRLHELSDADFLDCIRTYNGSPASALASPSLMKLMLPTMRADFELVEKYSYVRRPNLLIPITAFGGMADPFTPRAQLEAWSELTSLEFNLSYLPGDHFFHRGSCQALSAQLIDQLAAHGQALSQPSTSEDHAEDEPFRASFSEQA